MDASLVLENFCSTSRIRKVFSEGPNWSDLFTLCSSKKWKAAVNYSKILAYIVKIVKVLVRIISEHLLKAIFLRFETETVGPCLVWKLKWVGRGRGQHGLLGPPQYLRPCTQFIWVSYSNFLNYFQF